ncbi:glutathionylspermidine synthase family protein [Bacillus sp. 123MFChir2]|uniref:glutathionylspermidine synthase family protein n=1 Tax=Bacillus sp. 123MFChir2 TaxID=1169144 RepID=UPI0003804C42|nr:glutathionylspermidine synthase family protein [Bacillus sp. 123MFChir2]
MLFKQIGEEFHNLAETNERGFKETLKEVDQIIQQEGLIFKEKALPFSIQPLAITEEENKYFQRASETLSDALEIVLEAYEKDEEIKEFFSYYNKYTRLININPRYKRKIRISRFDCIWNGGEGFKVVEPNACCPGGVVVLGKLKERWVNLPFIKGITSSYEQEQFLCDTPNGFISELLNAYKEMGGNIDKPQIALVNYAGNYSYELEHIQKYGREMGHNIVICDLRDLKLDSQRQQLMYNECPIDIIYNKVDQLELGNKDMEDVIEACEKGLVCNVNSYPSMFIGESKMTLALLTDARFQEKYLSYEQVEMVNKHILWTRKLEETTTSFKGEIINLIEYVIDNKERFVLKIDNSTRGENVFLGKDADTEVWAKIVNNNKNTNWIVQEYNEIPSVSILEHKDGKIVKKSKKFGIDMFMFGGKYAGVVSRISDKAVINLGQGGYEQPVIVLKDVKEKVMSV